MVAAPVPVFRRAGVSSTGAEASPAEPALGGSNAVAEFFLRKPRLPSAACLFVPNPLARERSPLAEGEGGHFVPARPPLGASLCPCPPPAGRVLESAVDPGFPPNARGARRRGDGAGGRPRVAEGRARSSTSPSCTGTSTLRCSNDFLPIDLSLRDRSGVAIDLSNRDRSGVAAGVRPPPPRFPFVCVEAKTAAPPPAAVARPPACLSSACLPPSPASAEDLLVPAGCLPEAAAAAVPSA